MKKRKITKDDNQKITYASSGVNIEKANDLIEEIKPIIKNTQRLGADGTIGGFGGIFDIGLLNYNDPLLVSSTDGVGTKLLVAIENDFYDHIGIDLVAMCVNDLIVQGAEPLYFLDYFATGQLSNSIAKKIIKSISDGCIESNCALIGGETAEMPGLYEKGHFDLAGFSVGVVERNKLLPKQNIEKGDLLIGLPSNGLHSNGYSLVRDLIKKKKINIKKNKFLKKELLKPKKIYVKEVLSLLDKNILNGCANITGGGLKDNIKRIIPNNFCAEIDLSRIKTLKIFKWLKNSGIKKDEMLKTFNCGVGFCLIINKKNLQKVKKCFSKQFQPYVIGKISKNSKKVIINGKIKW